MGFEIRHRDGGSPREVLVEALARAHRLEIERAREVLRRAEQAAAEDPRARSVQQWFVYLVEGDARTRAVEPTTHELTPDSRTPAMFAPGRQTLAMRGLTGSPTPDRSTTHAPGRQTLVLRELTGSPSSVRSAAHVPGRQTRVMLEGQREDEARQAPAPREPSIDASQREPERLGASQQWRMSQAFGFDFSGVSIRRDSRAATGSTRAVVKDGEIHFREGAYQPDTRTGDWLIAHELAHVVQQQGGRGERAASRQAIEREADRAASLAVLGRAAPIALRAQAAVAYAFSDAEEHEAAAVEAPAAAGAETATSEGDGDVGGGDAEAVAERAPAEHGPDAGDAEPVAANATDEKEGEGDDSAAPESVRVAPPTAAESAAPETAAPEGHEGTERHAHAEGVAADAAEDAAIDADAADAHEEPASAHAPVAPEIAALGSAPDGTSGAGKSEAGSAGASVDAGAGAETATVAGASGDEEEAAGEEGTYDPRADLAMPSVPGEGGGGGGAPGGGGGAAPKPQKAAPSVAATPPEAGFTQLQGVRPDKLVPALGQIHGAATTDVGKQRAEAKANPPKQMSDGGGAAAKGKPGGDAGAPGGGKKVAAAGSAERADKPVKGEVPGGAAAKQAQQGQAQQQQQNAGAAITATAQQNASWLRAFNGKPAGGASGSGGGGGGGGGAGSGGGQPTMTDAEMKQMSGSLASIPTKASDISADPGPAPELAMKGQAKATSGGERARLETQTAQLQSQGQAESRVPLGEDHIETSVATQELTAKSVAGGAVPAVAMPTVAGAAPTEEVAIVAQEDHGAQIDAALAKASGDVATERAKHAQEDQKARTEADKQISDLKTKADADQVAARTAAKAESDKARGAWQAEIDKKGADARKQADKKVSEGMAQVEAEETKANEEAKKHIDEGKQKAEQAKQKGEQEAEAAKDKGKEKSSGFFGWLSSKAKALFDGIKQAISAAIDACRRAVKAVVAAAKQLAMAAIELARKAIVAAIKEIGEALLAITDILLAAFPELKAKFQAAIRAAVNKAVDTVNKLAEGLKKAVQAALDLLGKGLDAALGLLEKGLHAVVDLVADVVQGAIDAAKAIVDALGQWVKIIKDVAKGPGAWIGKLGAAVVDGIKNHLWSAFKTVVVDWFKSKVIEVLGVAGMILQVLMEGGITMDDIVKMAIDALIVAIPMALVAILIEKLVAMIVPAAGAVMAIIEGLQAAWGTISRIIAAFSAFMAFLSAVQGGSAGPQFATALASAAVVVLDFVANWLLKKLRGPASKVGKRLEGMAQKFKRKGKGKPGKPGSKPKHTGHDADGPGAGAPKGKPKQKHDDADGPNGTKGKPKQKHDDADGPNGMNGKPKQKHDDADGPNGTKGKPKQKHDDADGPNGKPKKKPDKDKDKKDKKDKKDEREARRIAKDAARRAWDIARRRTQNEVTPVAALESAIRGAERTQRGFRVTVDVVVNGRSWNVRARAAKGSASGTATKGRGWVALDGGARWLAAQDQTRKHDGIVREADQLLDQEAREVSKQHGQMRDLHQALKPRIQKIERTLTGRLLKGIRFTINENEFTEGKDERGDNALLYSWEIRPNASKNKIAASGGKKRGDHVFAHGLTKLPAELRSYAAKKELHGSKAGLDAAISSISGSVSHAAFELVVHKPEVAGKDGDPQSQAFGGALRVFRGVFDTFLSNLELVDLAVATESSSAAEVAAANVSLAAVKSQWASLIETVHDRDCTAHLDGKGKGLEREGVAILTTLKTSFPQALTAVVAADAKLQVKPADPDAKAPDAKAPDAKAPESKTGGS